MKFKVLRKSKMFGPDGRFEIVLCRAPGTMVAYCHESWDDLSRLVPGAHLSEKTFDGKGQRKLNEMLGDALMERCRRVAEASPVYVEGGGIREFAENLRKQFPRCDTPS